MGVWIETHVRLRYDTRECVTPCMGVWIETQIDQMTNYIATGHTLYGCVD